MKLILYIAFSFITAIASCQVKIPAKIEAESYTTMTGVTVTSDNTGRKFVNLSAGDVLNYSVSVPASGFYSVVINLGDGGGGAKTNIVRQDGTVLSSFTTPVTGGLTTFKTITDTIKLSAGNQTIRLVDVTGGYNVDWFEIKQVTVSTPTASNTAIDTLKARITSLENMVLKLQGYQINNDLSIAILTKNTASSLTAMNARIDSIKKAAITGDLSPIVARIVTLENRPYFTFDTTSIKGRVSAIETKLPTLTPIDYSSDITTLRNQISGIKVVDYSTTINNLVDRISSLPDATPLLSKMDSLSAAFLTTKKAVDTLPVLTMQGFPSPAQNTFINSPVLMTQAQRIALTGVRLGYKVYQTDAPEGEYIYKSSGWVFIK